MCIKTMFSKEAQTPNYILVSAVDFNLNVFLYTLFKISFYIYLKKKTKKKQKW